MYKLTNNSKVLQEFLFNDERFGGIKTTLTRSNGSQINIETKSSNVKVGNLDLYVYEVNGKVIYSETDVLSSYISGDTSLKDTIANELLGESNVDKHGYIGRIIKDGSTLSIDYSNSEIFNESFKQLQTKYQTWFNNLRGNNRSTTLGTDQHISSINRNQRTNEESSYLIKEKIKVEENGEMVEKERYVGKTTDPAYQDSFDKMCDYITTKYNMEQSTIIQTITEVIDKYAGACSYADLSNVIFATFMDNPTKFEEKFGFSMYITVNGEQILNSKTLLLDMYISANSKENGGKIFELDSTGKRVISIVKNSKTGNFRLANDNEQVYMSGRFGYTENAKSYLESKGLTLISNNITKNNRVSDSELDIERLKELVKYKLANGEIVSLDEFSKADVVKEENGQKTYNYKTSKLTFYNMDGLENISTYNWKEGGGHATTIIGMQEDGFIIISWGREYLVKFEDLHVDNFEIQSSKIVEKTSNISST